MALSRHKLVERISASRITSVGAINIGFSDKKAQAFGEN